MQLRTEVKKKMFLDALQKTLGVKYRAMKEVGISDQRVIDKWRAKDAKFAAAMDEVANIALDFVESQLYKKIQEGDTTSIIFYLKTKGKKRGYVERQEIAPAEGGCFVLNLQAMPADEMKRLEDESKNRIANEL